VIEKCDEEGEDEALESYVEGQSKNPPDLLNNIYKFIHLGNEQVPFKNSFSSLSQR